MRAFNETVVAEFRANGGSVGGRLAGQPLVLLTTVGARSGQPRTTPLGCLRDGDRLVLFASNMGAAEPPAWFRNLVTNPEVMVEVGTERVRARAAVAAGAERERLYEAFVARFPGIAGHQARAGRPIPVVVLERIG
jgi:deazaflavin-dependent oxidoreductase (nitroreductase family)